METVDWVSPLRPDRTDIAEYTERVRTALADVVGFNAIGNKDAARVAAYERRFPPFFNLGNDGRFHDSILTACRSMAGIVIAHDYHIQNLILSHVGGATDGWEERYVGAMAATYGAEGQQAARKYVTGALSLDRLGQDFPGLEYATDNALCVITHNPALAEEIARRSGLFCGVLPLPFLVSERDDPIRTNRTRQGDIELLVFGYLGGNRQVETVCDLLSDPRFSRFRLNIAGAPTPDVQDSINRHVSKGGRIADHGFLPEDELNTLIRRADLVLNLRSPSMGEVSGSQLRIFANRGVSAVVNNGWYSSLPDDAVVKIGEATMKADLAAIFDRLTNGSPQDFTGQRERGYRYVKEHHSLDAFRSAYERLCEVLPEALMHGRRIQMAMRMKSAYQGMGANWNDVDAVIYDKVCALV